jgi:hypothetical protein
MTKRIEQSRKHGHHDARWAGPLHAVSEPSLPVEAPETPISSPAALALVGAMDFAPDIVDPDAGT